MDRVVIRPMTAADLDAVEHVVASTYDVVVPGDAHLAPAWRTRWRMRAEHLLRTDPDGSRVAVLDGRLVGFAISFRRDATWFLSSYAVRPEAQGQGLGRLLLEAVQTGGRAMLSASADPRALARYRAAGFTLVPQWRFTGVPQVGPITGSNVTPDLDALDRDVRGAAHGPDHALLGGQFRLIGESDGYAYLDETCSPSLLCARDTGAATRLLLRALASAPGEITVGHVSEANAWARRVTEDAGMIAHEAGFLAVRGMEPPSPYLHHGALL